MTAREQIVQQALSLNPEDRAYVVDVLEESLGSGEFTSPAIAAAWSVEIERRVAAYDRGEVQAAEVHPSLERMRRHLREHRAKKVAR
jgi:hypothetical protein